MSLVILWRCAPVPWSDVPRWRVWCDGCFTSYVTSGVRWRVERRKGCRSCAGRGNKNARGLKQG